MTQIKRIESYGLYDFCQDIQEAFKEGYVFDFDTNENFPTAYGTMLTCGLVKAGEKVEAAEQVAESDASNDQEVAEVVTEVEATDTEVETPTEQAPADTPAKRGPKPKSK